MSLKRIYLLYLHRYILLVRGVIQKKMAHSSEKNGTEFSGSGMRYSAQWFSAIFEGSRDAIFITTAKGFFANVNHAAVTLTGYSKNELLKMSIPDLYDPMDLKAYHKYFDRIMAGEDITSEALLRRKDNSHLHVEFSNKRIEIGEEIFMHTIAREIGERKRIEKALIESEMKYRNLFENSIEGIGISKGNRIVFANQSLARMFGYETPEECIKVPLLDHVAPELLPLIIERMKARENGKDIPAHYEYKIIRKNGELRDIEISTSEITIGKEKFVQSTLRDITERKQSEERLLKSEKLLSETQKTANIGSWDWDLKTGKAIWSDQLYNIYGRSSDLGVPEMKTFLDQYHPDDRKQVQNAIDDAIKNYLPYNIDYRIYRENDGAERWIRSQGLIERDENGKPVRLLGIAQDITDRKKADDIIRQANNYNRSLIEASLDPLVTIGPDGKIQDVNTATEEITGYSRQELIGTDFSGYFTNPARAEIGYQEVFLKGFVRDFALDIKSHKGNVVPVLYNAKVYRDEKGIVLGVFAAARDITELKNAENKLKQGALELRDLAHHLEEVRENERTLIARDLHDDLGQKLTALKMDISWLKSRIGVQSRYVQHKLNEMVSLLNEAVESTKKISYGLRPSILDDLGLQAAIEWLLTDFNKSTGVEYKVTFVPHEILIDKKVSLTVFRIIQEALTNVARHSGAKEVSLKLSLIKNSLKLMVTDNGSGINEEQINSPKSFGLRGMKERVLSCGGNFEIAGRKGKGTEILVTMPVKSNDSLSIPVLR
jgi:PAS domain S-box-containing protein